MTKNGNIIITNSVTGIGSSAFNVGRMIWLVCTGNYFLDSTRNTKIQYMREIAI